MDRKKKILAAVAVGFLVSSLFPACSAETQKKVLSTFFDGVDSPPPPTQRVRRDLLREIEELKREVARLQQELAALREGMKTQEPGAASQGNLLPAEQAKSWQEAALLLPKDAAGGIDWVQALKAGTIAPRPGIGPKAADQPVLPLTVERTPAGQEAFKAVFPHDAHTQWLACANCHPAIFQMQRGATPINMGLIYAGQTCGSCHGKVAFPVTACGRCHPALAGGK